MGQLKLFSVSREADPEETHGSLCESRARLHAGGGDHLLLAIGPRVWPRLGRGSEIGTGGGASGQGRACLSWILGVSVILGTSAESLVWEKASAVIAITAASVHISEGCLRVM